MDLAGPFIDPTWTDERDNTLLHLLARYYFWGYDPDKFALLIERGVNLNARNRVGRTCLHLFNDKVGGLYRSRRWLEELECLVLWTQRELECLVLLIQKGADVSAVDCFGYSVSYYAYRPNCPQIEHLDVGGYRGDLWDATLARYGYDIYKKRKETPHPRRPRYTEYYTRVHFEELWKGFEDLCPYYHDPPIWPPCMRSPEICERN